MQNGVGQKYSFPKERINVLLLENIHETAREEFHREGYNISELKKSLSEDELIERIPDVSLLGVRSNTAITPKVLAAGKRLLGIGAFCIGTNKIALPEAAGRGVVVFNAPFSNTRSVVEMVIAEIIGLNRKLTEKNAATHAGKWEKSAVGCHEIRGRSLGIVGYGHIGSQLSVLAEALGMSVYFYDVDERLAFGNAKRCESLDDLLAISDVVSVHVDGRPANKNLFGAKQFAVMRSGAMFLNLSRGTVVVVSALKDALVSGHLSGAAVDVFPSEPKEAGAEFQSELRGLPNVILTPHVASGTQEAQASIGHFVSTRLINFINEGNTSLSVNLPEIGLPLREGSHRLILVHRNVPGVLAKVAAVLASGGVNIDGQMLGTNGDTGYVITDINTDYDPKFVKSLRELPETIRLRVLY